MKQTRLNWNSSSACSVTLGKSLSFAELQCLQLYNKADNNSLSTTLDCILNDMMYGKAIGNVMDRYIACALLKDTWPRQQVRLESLCPVTVQRKGHLFWLAHLEKSTFMCFFHQEGAPFCLIKGSYSLALSTHPLSLWIRGHVQTHE